MYLHEGDNTVAVHVSYNFYHQVIREICNRATVRNVDIPHFFAVVVDRIHHIDGQLQFPNNAPAGPLPVGPANKRRDGVQAVSEHGKIKITQVLEIIPSRADPKAPNKKRLRDTVLVNDGEPRVLTDIPV